MADLTDDAGDQSGSGAPGSDVAMPLNGNPPIPVQADTMAIAKRLLGPELAARYGDVIGARPTTAGDVARDVAIGTMSGDPGKAESIKAQVVGAYQQAYQRQQAIANAQDAQNRAKVGALFNTLQQVRQVPEQYRKDFLKESLGQLGMQASPFVQKLLADPDAFKGAEALTSPDMLDLADNNPKQFLENATKFLGDAGTAMSALKTLQSISSQHEQTQDKILDQQRKVEQTRALKLKNDAAAAGGGDELAVNAQTVLQTIPKVRAVVNKFFEDSATGAGLMTAVANRAKLLRQKEVTIPNLKAQGQLGELDYLNSKVIPLIRASGRGTKGLRITQAEFSNIGDAFAHPENYTKQRMNSYLDAVEHDFSQLVKEGKIPAGGGSSTTPTPGGAAGGSGPAMPAGFSIAQGQ